MFAVYLESIFKRIPSIAYTEGASGSKKDIFYKFSELRTVINDIFESHVDCIPIPFSKLPLSAPLLRTGVECFLNQIRFLIEII